ncbi:hypothetical protein NPIL_284341 [Nephila pilipes]|uniref:Uncharacterized protein n=1 Tax=Nephila pilipes TaxID=299642 RepID=A0A8X6N8X1_NEPPI|nr:hypothetical protein NPIL_284341 [Nephila pilipes]
MPPEKEVFHKNIEEKQRETENQPIDLSRQTVSSNLSTMLLFPNFVREENSFFDYFLNLRHSISAHPGGMNTASLSEMRKEDVTKNFDLQTYMINNPLCLCEENPNSKCCSFDEISSNGYLSPPLTEPFKKWNKREHDNKYEQGNRLQSGFPNEVRQYKEKNF